MCLTSLRKPKFFLLLLLPWFIESSLGSEKGELSPYELGMRYLSEQKHDLAEESFLQALRDPAAPVETHFQLAWIYTATGDWKKAESAILQFIKKRPGSSEAEYILGYSLFRQNSYAEAVPVLQKAMTKM